MPEHQIELGFLELMAPNFEDALLKIARRGPAAVTVVPLFLAPGGHLRADLPKLISAGANRHPELQLRQLPPLGDSQEVLEAIAAWIVAAQALYAR